jgi:hypothetical protein
MFSIMRKRRLSDLLFSKLTISFPPHCGLLDAFLRGCFFEALGSSQGLGFGAGEWRAQVLS